MLQRLVLKDFTAFDKLDMEFSPGVNLLIGDNGTGKTHILKILYSPLAALKEEKRIAEKIIGAFLPKEKRIGRLVKRGKNTTESNVSIYKDNKLLQIKFYLNSNSDIKERGNWGSNGLEYPVYIPAKEMLANAPGFLSLYKTRNIHFEEIYADIFYHAYAPHLNEPIPRETKELSDALQQLINGKVIIKGEHFYLKNKSGELEFTLLAEGIRKLGLLWLLIKSGSLSKGAVLFWDEPEANLNPSLLHPLVNVLLRLQRIGLQIFIATHNYVLLREFDLQMTSKDKVRYFELSRSEETNEIVCQSVNNYLDIIPNKISDAYSAIYDAIIMKMGGLSSND
ncbi:MAG: AAA family ATPase [Candidatus Hatepunaea meridiana]|nr:AAA family ATPase [Candidatus Hatepunaea meridiana]